MEPRFNTPHYSLDSVVDKYQPLSVQCQ